MRFPERLSASDEVVMVRMGSLGRKLAAARAERMALTTVPGWVRIWRGVKCSTVMPCAAIRASRARVRSWSCGDRW